MMMAVNGLVTLIGLVATCFAAWQYDGSMRLIALGLIGIYSSIGFLGSFVLDDTRRLIQRI